MAIPDLPFGHGCSVCVPLHHRKDGRVNGTKHYDAHPSCPGTASSPEERNFSNACPFDSDLVTLIVRDRARADSGCRIARRIRRRGGQRIDTARSSA
jgi:hypothetical protein